MKHITQALAVFILITCGTLFAQETFPQPISPVHQMNLSGPRMGFTILTGQAARTMEDEYDLIPVITQFGWQSEVRFFSVADGPTGLMEFVGLIGGVEQEMFLPSLSWLAGVRMPDGREFGVGPNISVTGTAYVIAGGFTRSYGAMNFPINYSILLSKTGARLSLLVGFNAVANKL
ncbi:hypothetical protein ACFL6Q_03775 [Candidatus Neomarinimicrobiota bacterium]